MYTFKYQARLTLININSDETFCYSFVVSVNKCSWSFNTITDSYDPICVPDKLRNINVEVLNLISRLNETRYLVQHESRNGKSIDLSFCEKCHMWNLSTCDYECNKDCKIGEYLDIRN